jgi:hypothetical protein
VSARDRGDVLLSCLCAIGCAATDVVIAELPVEGGSERDAACTDDDCAPARGCIVQDCEAGDSCQPLPEHCSDERDPVCGCDGISYWNDCLRRQSGVPDSTWDPCHRNARSCHSDEDCGPRGSCAHLISQSDRCSEIRDGTCWVLPPICPPSQIEEWIPCGRIDPRCLGTCEAIQSGEPHRRAGPNDYCR